MRILSFDCANKSLAHSYLELNVSEPKNGLVTINTLIMHHCEAVDLLPFEQVAETDIIKRSVAMYDYLSSLTYDVIDLILVEFQMGPNDKSRTVCDQIIMFFVTKGIRNFFVIRPSYKNEIHLVEQGEFWRFLEQRQDTYLARKKHAKFNFVEICKLKNIDISHIKEKWREDVGDSFMQAVAYQSGIVNKKIEKPKKAPKKAPRKPKEVIEDPWTS